MSLARAVLAVSGAALLTAGISLPAAAAPPTDPQYPACADIVDGGIAYTENALAVRLDVDAPTCPGIKYSVLVFDEPGDDTPLATSQQRGTGDGPSVFFNLPVVDDDREICVRITTSRGNRAIDLAPDTACGVLVEDPDNASGFSFR